MSSFVVIGKHFNKLENVFLRFSWTTMKPGLLSELGFSKQISLTAVALSF